MGLDAQIGTSEITIYLVWVLLVFGLGLTSALMILHARFLWWPLHPLGYAMANSWGMSNLWSCLSGAWLTKLLILRHGGLRLYRRAVPFFLGMALGDYIFGGIWSIGSILTNTTLYQLLAIKNTI